jgi:4-hydroxybenzoate polyprenyltransferase
MKRQLLDSWKSLLQLLRFLFWYGIAVAALLFVLPAAGVLVEQHYEALSSTLKFFSVLGMFAVIGAWQVLGMRDRR